MIKLISTEGKNMKKEKSITIKLSEAEYERIKKCAKRENLTVSDYVRPLLNEDLTKDWIKKTIVQRCLSHIKLTLDKNEEKNKRLTDMIKRELENLWIKL